MFIFQLYLIYSNNKLELGSLMQWKYSFILTTFCLNLQQMKCSIYKIIIYLDYIRKIKYYNLAYKE